MPSNLHPDAEAVLGGALRSDNPDAMPALEAVRGTRASIQALIAPARQVYRSWTSTITIDGRVLDIRWYQPSPDHSELVTLFIHGGGWVSGTLDDYDALCRSLALSSHSVVASLGYSLAPAARFPVAVEQVRQAMLQALETARNEGVQVQQVAVVGDSAGANLIGGALHTLVRLDLPRPARAVLIYPATDTSMEHHSWRELGNGYHLTTTKMDWFWAQYLGPGWRSDQALAMSPQAAPLLSPYLDRFPPSLIITAACDPLKDEGLALFRRLTDAGVSAEHIEVPGQIHGFLRFDNAMLDPEWGAQAVIARIGAFLRS